MAKKVSDIVGMLNYEELIDLQRDLFGGGTQFKQLVSNKIKEVNESQTKICATCGSSVNMRENYEYTLIFGSKDLKKRASFCAVDCLEYFFIQLKTIANKRLQSSSKQQN